ncbi:two-component system response regulator [Luteitalea sp. TBR-22]|uniref:HDOD domain-containing protein n=1 Tax=Luteitalea sp. TBR-22 TaxID=2802971 RepID=UPI001AFC93AC|nr:HDOD domain-containing protein [Luteitalea sp. TBR-22]BCS32161.1 two-component system response regulator [Luteitalea sp. TBR-22]
MVARAGRRGRPRQSGTSGIHVLLQAASPARRDALGRELARVPGWQVSVVDSVDEALYALETLEIDAAVCEVVPGEPPTVLAHAQAHHPEVLRVALALADAPRAVDALRHAHTCLPRDTRAGAVALALQQSLRVRGLLCDETLKTLVLGLEVLPSVPQVLQQLLAELRGPDPSVARVGALVEQDAGATAELLHVVNSPLLGLRQPVSDAALAVTLLGLDTVGAVLVQQQWLSQADAQTLERLGLARLFSHGLRTARRAAALGHHFRLGHDAIGAARAAGLLHDVGKLVLAINFPDKYRQAQDLVESGEVPLRVAETILIGAPHDWVGGHLLALWGLPDAIVEAVAFHHDPRYGGASASVALGLVHLANRLEHARDAATPNELDGDYLAAIGCPIDGATWPRLLELES